MMMSSIVPVVPKNTSGAKDFFFMPTGIARRAPATEKTQVPRALHAYAKLCQHTILQAKLLPRELLVIAHRFRQYICKVHKSTDA
jgi:hypothetical protein